MTEDTREDRNLTRTYLAGEHLSQEGEVRRTLLFVEAGWAFRYRALRDGRRQITALYLPGDYCEPQWLLDPVVQQPVIASTRVTARVLMLSDLYERNSGLHSIEAVLGSALSSLNKQAEWIVTLGRRNAHERVAIVLCDIFDRMRRAGLVQNDQCAMPLMQIDLADLTGLTAVHINRVLAHLRLKGLVDVRGKWLKLPDRDALLDTVSPMEPGNDVGPEDDALLSVL